MRATVSAEPFYERRAPSCYRRPSARTAMQSRSQVDGNVVLLALSLVTAIAVFLLTYRSELL
jgi:hypothetical protein